jgi:hypothetical protein
MSNLYRVRWETDIEAETEIEAARIAMIQQRDNDPDRIDNCFDVAEITETGVKDFVSVDIDTIDGRC